MEHDDRRYVLALPSAAPLWWDGARWSYERSEAVEVTADRRARPDATIDREIAGGAEWFEVRDDD